MLEIRELETGYGKKQVLFGLSMDVREGEIVALIGPNGAGKSTVLKSVCGLFPAWKGEIHFDGLPLDDFTPAQRVARQITFAPQGGRVFSDLTVMENLEVGGFQLPRKVVKKRISLVLEFFPELKDRTNQDAGKLSGGEQQMLALARALVSKPRLLLLDEPSLGLSPKLVKSVFGKIVELQQELELSVLIVEQKVREVLGIASKVYGMKLGQVVFDGDSRDLIGDSKQLKEIFL
ncbi:MAG: ABC transporter ATP-binding protein [Candidatus Thorarchaeota archaeon]